MVINDELLQKHCLQLTQHISQGVELKQILMQIIQYIEGRFEANQLYTAFFDVDIHRKKINPLASSSSLESSDTFMPQFEKLYFDQLNKDLQIGKTVMISKDEENEHWEQLRSLCDECCFESALTLPLYSSYQYLLGILFIMFRKNHKPDLATLQIIQHYNQIASIAIELSQLEVERKQKASMNKGINVQTVTDDTKQYKELKEALEKDQFKIYYQPYYGLKQKEYGLEALIRWKHPNYGLLSPASFLDSAEKTGFIIELEEWVLQKSLDDIKRLEREGLENIQLSVNISAKQFENGDYPNKVTDLLERYSILPNQLTLEITERFLVEKNSITEVQKIKDLGVRISIDDFGTSYSSLHYLKDLPIDELKIDRSFISNIDVDFNNKKIVEMIIMLGHQLNLTTVAEGIETKKQYEIMKQIDCDRVQGFLFSKPIPVNKVAQTYEDYFNNLFLNKKSL